MSSINHVQLPVCNKKKLLRKDIMIHCIKNLSSVKHVERRVITFVRGMLSYNIAVISTKASVVDTFNMKLYWKRRMILYLIKNELSQEYINFFRILDTPKQDKSELTS